MNAPKVTNTHEWMRINFGNNRGLSCSYSGSKATGKVPASVFNLWADAHEFKPAAIAKLGLVSGESTHGDITDAFAAQIDTIWPGWNIAPKIPAVGETVALDFGKRRGGVDTGPVEKVRGTNVTVRFSRMGLVSVAADTLKE